MRSYIKITIILFLLFVVEQNTFGQLRYNFTNYSVADGLEQADILALNQAKNGYLLYGSNGGGLGVFDGYSFFTIKEKNGLANNVVFGVSVASTGKVWVATKQGISKVDNTLSNVLSNYQTDKSFYCTQTNTANTTVWFGSAKGLYQYDEKVDSVIFYKSSNTELNAAFINCIYIDAANNVWVGTREHGVFKINKDGEVQNFTEKDGLLSNYIKTIIEGQKNELFIGSIKGIDVIDQQKIYSIDLPQVERLSLTITSSARFNKNELVFGALNKQLYFLDINTKKYRIIREDNGFNYSKIWTIFTDNESNLWLGSIGNGIIKPNFIFNSIDKNSGLTNSYINTIYENNNEEVLIGYTGGIDVFKDENRIKSFSNIDIDAQFIFHINEVNNQIIIGTNNGLKLLKDNKFYPTIIVGGEKTTDDIYTTYWYNNSLFVGGKSGIYRYQNDTLYLLKDTPIDAIYAIQEYKGKLYLASNNGVYSYANNTFTFLSKEEQLFCNRARSFRVDDKNNLWIGTSDGIYIYDGKKFNKLNEQNGLTSENVYFLEKTNDFMFVGSNKGIDKIKIASVYEFLNDATKKIDVKNFSKHEGFNGVECNLNAVYKNKNGELYFGTINGIYIYNEEYDIKNTQPPILSLNTIKLNFEDVDWSTFGEVENKLPKNLSLTYVNNNLIFEYVGVSLTNPEQVVYQYKLEGLDNNWLPTTTDQKAVYTAIPPGDYTFMLKAKNADGVWIEEPLTFSFSITPPWWQTTWFYVIAVFTVLLSFYFIMDYRTKKLKKEQQILTQKVDERTKELREEKEKVEQINSKLETQKKIIEVANKNITDSINYAKKIQEAILPKATKLEKIIDFISILFVPKDVVSGDFYWFEKMGKKIVLAAADCTGHGVPGAFMSMIGINNLNQIVLENKTTEPDTILKELNNSIKKALKQDDKDSESKDGMDIALTCIDYETNTLTYSGAFRPLVYIRNNELFELKGSRQPIGGSAPNDFAYDLHTIPLQKGDVFYLFSDGYPDQFGGPKGKKLMNKNLKDKFLAIHQESPAKQKEILLTDFNAWKGDNEQIDDILIIVIKI